MLLETRRHLDRLPLVVRLHPVALKEPIAAQRNRLPRRIGRLFGAECGDGTRRREHNRDHPTQIDHDGPSEKWHSSRKPIECPAARSFAAGLSLTRE
jgi:hypothetical protein